MELSQEKLLEMYKKMVTVREFEQSLSEAVASGTLPGFVHLGIGQEAVHVGVAYALRATDWVTSTHRDHGMLIARGADIKRCRAEIFGKADGYCKGKGGSMHIADLDLGIMGANGIVGGGPPLAAGAALACQYLGNDSVAVCFFGDGASNQGTTHEAMNLATCWKLPVVFVNENNMYGISSCTLNSMCVPNVADRAAGYDMPGVVVDGNDVIAVYEAAAEAISRARQGKGPSLIECKTYRHRGHFEGDPCDYRDNAELEEWKEKDPIPRLEQKLLEMELLTDSKIKEIKSTLQKELASAEQFAEESPFPDVSELTEDVYT